MLFKKLNYVVFIRSFQVFNFKRLISLKDKAGISFERIRNYSLFHLAYIQILQFVYPLFFFIFARRVNEEEIGTFNFSYKIGSLSIELFANAMITVLFPNFCEKGNEERNKKYLNMSLKYLINYGLVCVIGFFNRSNSYLAWARKSLFDELVGETGFN